MKKLKSFLMLCLLGTAITSCKAPENVIYLQDLDPNSITQVPEISLVTVKPTDKLMINVNSRDENIAGLFNLKNMNQGGIGGGSTTGSNYQDLISYTVSQDGCIDFPVVGPIHVAGLTRQQVANTVRDILLEQNLIKDPYVTCAFANFGFYAVGEVGHPGRTDIRKDEINILEALASAGDLSLSGDRTNIQVFRQSNGALQTFQIDLTQASTVFNSPAFYIQPEDIIYVHPTIKKQYETTTLGNTVRTPSFWIGLTSSILSLGVAIFAVFK